MSFVWSLGLKMAKFYSLIVLIFFERMLSEFCTEMWPLVIDLGLLEASHFGEWFFPSKDTLFLTDSMKINIFGGLY